MKLEELPEGRLLEIAKATGFKPTGFFSADYPFEKFIKDFSEKLAEELSKNSKPVIYQD
jgi:hypothetical protein